MKTSKYRRKKIKWNKVVGRVTPFQFRIIFPSVRFSSAASMTIIIMIVIRKNDGFVDDSSGVNIRVALLTFFQTSSHTIDELKNEQMQLCAYTYLALTQFFYNFVI